MITAIRKRKPVFDSSQSVISEAMGLFIFFPFQCGLFPYLGLALSDVTLVIDTTSSKELEENYGVGFLVLQGFAISTSAIRARFYFSIVNRRVTRFVDGLGIHCPPLVSPFFDCTCFWSWHLTPRPWFITIAISFCFRVSSCCPLLWGDAFSRRFIWVSGPGISQKNKKTRGYTCLVLSSKLLSFWTFTQVQQQYYSNTILMHSSSPDRGFPNIDSESWYAVPLAGVKEKSKVRKLSYGNLDLPLKPCQWGCTDTRGQMLIWIWSSLKMILYSSPMTAPSDSRAS